MKEKNSSNKMMTKYKYWNIEIDGPDKVGKTLLCQYITQLSNYRFATHARGYMTQVAYARKFERPYLYTKPDTNTIFIMLTTSQEEHDIRCAITHEPKIDYAKDRILFEEIYDELVNDGYKCLRYDTSYMTFYQIALSIIKNIDFWEAEN